MKRETPSAGVRAVRLRSLSGELAETFLVYEGCHRIGRSAESEICVRSRDISRFHALLKVTPEGMAVKDLGSENGTWVNGARIDGQQDIREDDVLNFGAEVSFRIETVEPEGEDLAIEFSWQEQGLGELGHDAVAEETTESIPRPDQRLVHHWRQDRSGLVFPDNYLPGSSLPMVSLYRQIRKLLDADVPILISGESGVGKEEIARILHASSRRSAGPFVAINCAAIPAELIEAELYGVGPGVATGVTRRQGRFQLAEGGVLLLDEIGEMALPLQAKLLRTLQEKTVMPLGEPSRPIDVRILASTNCDLLGEVAAGRFRRDLYFRIAGVKLEVPPLRRCRDDIPRLVKYFLDVYQAQDRTFLRGVTKNAMDRLVSYGWPGNVRELIHEIRRLTLLSNQGDVIDSARLSHMTRMASSAAPEGSLHLTVQVRALETRLILEALRRTQGNQVQAARLLSISRNGLAKKMRRLAIETDVGPS